MSPTQLMVVPEGAGAKKPGSELRLGMVIVAAPFWKDAVAVTVIELTVVPPVLHPISA